MDNSVQHVLFPTSHNLLLVGEPFLQPEDVHLRLLEGTTSGHDRHATLDVLENRT
jgi:hypothetical protein